MVVPFWTPITPLTRSLLHADPQSRRLGIHYVNKALGVHRAEAKVSLAIAAEAVAVDGLRPASVTRAQNASSAFGLRFRLRSASMISSSIPDCLRDDLSSQVRSSGPAAVAKAKLCCGRSRRAMYRAMRALPSAEPTRRPLLITYAVWKPNLDVGVRSRCLPASQIKPHAEAQYCPRPTTVVMPKSRIMSPIWIAAFTDPPGLARDTDADVADRAAFRNFWLSSSAI